ncbi:zinc finger protein 700-like [Achroia grisella]|uniref:zinc finger protein 700-like n=1 Tax=Achroia grisella TaxID=688607 RepID=UPI0027D29240|nr:zinc finger protein 700-like [Achroia grisella]XP_059044824.1 zinc finger protein 700-like [Achroia grisella]
MNTHTSIDSIKIGNMNVDIDPLSTYEYPTYSSYNNIPNPHQYSYDVKVENPINEFLQSFMNVSNNDNDVKLPEQNQENISDKEVIKNTINEDVKPNIDVKSIKKERNGKKSNYWSEKITDNTFAFYGCAVCNVRYTALHELDQHVTIHKDRITSYDLKIKNQLKRKKLKKEQKRLKKMGKIKTEDFTVDIKPEDGYIGNEKASEFNFNENPDNGIPGNGVKDNGNAENGQVNNSVDGRINTNNESCANSNGNNSRSNENENGPNGRVKQPNLNLEKIYKCFACQKQFTLSYYLKLHVRSHTDEKPYTCSICGQSFITASKLGRHNKRIHLAIRYQCRICYRFFSKFEYLTRHFDKKHLEDKLEGEPYDYNAILPYLKELEEQLREKAEETKPKAEDLWEDWPPPPSNQFQEVDNKDMDGERPLDIVLEQVKVDFEVVKLDCDVEVKKELEEESTHEETEEFKEDCKDDNISDDDYFPSNTWASTPKIESDPPSPIQSRRKTEGPLECKICHKSISTASYMRIHMRTHTGEKPFKCYICNRGFITSSKMHRHVLTHSESWEGEDGAELKMENIKSEEEEGDEKKKVDKKALIKKAKAKFAKKMKKSEVSRRSQRRPHACSFCHKRFLHLETLQVHKKSHEGENLVLKCNFCLEEAADDEALTTHEATHTGPKPYLCTICGKSYKRRETMIYHRKHHKPEKEYICDICSKTFNAPCKLQRHIVSHRVDKFVLRYECPVCAHMFNTKYHIKMHLATHQKEGLIIEENRNDILAMVLQNARKIPKHADGQANIDMIPPDERSRVCNICGQVFQHFYYLEEHLKSHGSKIAIEDITKTEEKKHTCPVCNKSFKLHYYLKLHNFTHTKEKPYICQQCGKGFITKGKLKRHLETHSGLKKYQCHICYKFFTRTSYLRIHIRTIHGTQDYNFRLEKGYGAQIGSGMMGHHNI